MIKLYLSECKKIRKNKANVFLILLMIGWMCGITISSYQKEIPAYRKDMVAYKTFDGKELRSWKEVEKYKDTILTQYAGEATEALWNRYCDDYETLYKEFTKDIDVSLMNALFGEQYEELLEKAKQDGLSEEEIQHITSATAEYFVVQEDRDFFNQPNQPISFPAFYEKQQELHTLNYIYRDVTYSSPFSQEVMPQSLKTQSIETQPPLYFLSHKSENLKAILHPYPIEFKEDELFSKYVKQELNTSTALFGSTIGIQKLHQAFYGFSVLSLLLISIILANSFAIEKRTKMNQIIVPSPCGAAKICIAKLSAGLSIGVFSMALQILVIIIIGWILFPPSNWQLSVSRIGGALSYITYQDLILTDIQLLLLSALSVSLITLFLSCVTKNQFITIIASMLCILGPFFLYSNIPFVMTRFLPSSYLIPVDFLTSTIDSYGNTLAVQGPITIMLGQMVLWKDVAIWGWIILTIFLSLLMLFIEKRHYVSTHS